MEKILLYNRSSTIRDMIRIYLKTKYFIISINDPHKVLSLLSHHDFSLLILGIQQNIPDDEEKLLTLLQSEHSETPVFLITPLKKDLDFLLEKYKNISDGIIPPIDSTTLINSIDPVIGSTKTSLEHDTVKLPILLFYDSEDKPSHHTRELIEKLPGQGGVPILLLGNYGSKLELVPRLYNLINKRKKSYIIIPAHTYSERELHTELNRLHSDIETLSGQGTIFIRNVDQLSSRAQELLLEWTYNIDPELNKLDSSNMPAIFYSANPGILKKLESGFFNRELFYRINGFTVRMPLFRVLDKEIVTIFEKILETRAAQLGIPSVKLEPEIKDFLCAYSWPWNLVEVEWIIHHLLIGQLRRSCTVNDLIILTSQLHTTGYEETTEKSRNRYLPPISNAQNLNLIKFDSVLLEIVHNIKNPLVAIKTFTQLLPENYEDLEFRNEFFKLVNKDIKRIDNYLSDITFHIHLSDPEKTDLDLDQLVSELITTLNDAAGENSITLTYKNNSTHESELRIYSDSQMLIYAFTIIVKQGMADLDPGGQIQISARGESLPPPGTPLQLNFEMIGTHERKDSFHSLGSEQIDSKTFNLKYLLAERVLSRLNIRMEAQIITPKHMKVNMIFASPEKKDVHDS